MYLFFNEIKLFFCCNDNIIILYENFNHPLLSYVHRGDKDNLFEATAVYTFHHAWSLYLKKSKRERD